MSLTSSSPALDKKEKVESKLKLTHTYLEMMVYKLHCQTIRIKMKMNMTMEMMKRMMNITTSMDQMICSDTRQENMRVEMRRKEGLKRNLIVNRVLAGLEIFHRVLVLM